LNQGILNLYLKGEKLTLYRNFESAKKLLQQIANSKTAESLCLQITNLKIATFATGPANLTNLVSAQVGGFAELICGPPTFDICI
jgi:hypothetical protein